MDGAFYRARIVAISKDRVADDAIKRIEDLAKPEWKGKVCARKGSHVYNRAIGVDDPSPWC